MGSISKIQMKRVCCATNNAGISTKPFWAKTKKRVNACPSHGKGMATSLCLCNRTNKPVVFGTLRNIIQNVWTVLRTPHDVSQ